MSTRKTKYSVEKIFVKKYHSILERCTNPKAPKYKYYGGKGIKCLITPQEIKSLWVRDNADQLKHASIDRIDSNKNYEINNCRFIELSENCGQARKGKGIVSKEEIKIKTRNRKLLNHKNGLCWFCTSPKTPGRCLCQRHLLILRERNKKRYALKKGVIRTHKIYKNYKDRN